MPVTQPTSWPSIPYLGPEVLKEPKKKGRFSYPLSQNETASLENAVYIGERILVSKREFEQLKTESGILKKYEEPIKQIAHNRIAAFFQQLVAVYNTQLHFEIGATKHQGESAKQPVVRNGERSIKLSMQAAHHSAIPCLYAYKLEDWRNYKNNNTLPRPKAHVYMKGSDGYRFWNTTIDMPRKFNLSVDPSVDKELRTEGLRILNLAAVGKTTPVKGLGQFVERFSSIVETQGRAAKDLDNAKHCGLDFYHEELRRIKTCLNKQPSNLDMYLGLKKVQLEDRDSEVIDTIYQIRYRAIQANWAWQSKIINTVETVRGRIFSAVPSSLFKKQLAFTELLIENMSDNSDQKRIKKLFNYSNSPVEKADRVFQSKRKIEKADYIKNDGSSQTGLKGIQQLAKKLSQMMQQMSSMEQQERRKNLLKLRKMRNLSQKKLSVSLKKSSDAVPSSSATIGRCERNERVVDDDLAIALSRALRVDQTLFMPAFFNS